MTDILAHDDLLACGCVPRARKSTASKPASMKACSACRAESPVVRYAALTNNLQDIDLDIPKQLVFTGPSGSGKSSSLIPSAPKASAVC